MALKLYICLLIFYFASIFSHATEAPVNNGDIYIVYMGANQNPNQNLLVTSLLRRNKNALVYNYKNGFSGFAARLSSLEATQLARAPGVVSVFRDPILQLHTTRSWDFLRHETSLLFNSDPRSNAADAVSSQGSDTIIGILDTGIWPESESFSDRDMGPIPTRWRGTCMEGPDFSSSNCSKKLIGARFYNKDEHHETNIHSARDFDGHGTHTSATAAGHSVPNATYYGLASGLARGGSPTSRLAMYQVCSESAGCTGSAILAAFDDAIADGVDLLSLSLGFSVLYDPDFSTDPIAIGAFHAVQNGITVVCSAGNAGPMAQTVVNVAPWIITVGATTIDRDFQSDVVLGNNKVIKGESINFSNLGNTPTIALISGVAAKNKSFGEDDARNCNPDALDAKKIKGKIVLCQHIDNNSSYFMYSKIYGVKESGGVGIIIISDDTRYVPSKSLFFPMTVISFKDAADVYAYMNSTINPVATILATKQVLHFKPAPVVAYFSSRGPSRRTKNLIKPDIAAPGVSILAAWMGNDTSIETTPKGRDPPQFNIISGTSMSCPHVTGIAANIKARNPSWSPAAIRSAIMTTATQINNLNLPITTRTWDVATPYDIGAGEVSSTGGLNPGLIYDMDPLEYLQFLCYYGYNITTIKLISPQLPPGFSCPVHSSASMISNLNYPSIAVSINSSTSPVTVKRTVTNVNAEEEAVYTVFVDKPAGVEVTVTPDELRFTADGKTMDYQVTFASSSSVKGNVFGAITWTNMKYKVRIPFVVISE